MPEPKFVIPSAASDAITLALYDYDDPDTDEQAWDEWRGDAEKLLLAALPHLVEHVAQKVEQGCPMPDAPPEHECGYRKSAAIVRGAFKEESC